ncbi:unnamed protein product [Diamesa serratosioi]
MEAGDEQKRSENPREKANIFSILTFWWTIDIFRKGYSKVLELEDLFKPLEVDKSEVLGTRLEKNWFKQLGGKKRPSLIKALCRTFWPEYTLLGIIAVINDIGIRLSAPIFLGMLLEYFRPDTEMTRKNAFIAAGALVMLNAISAVTINQFLIGSFANGMKVRVAVCSLIYRKSLRLSSTALGDTAPGKIVNLLSNDVSRFDVVSVFIHSLWLAPLLSIIIGYILWVEVGYAGLVGIIIVFIVTPIQSYTGKLSSKFRMQTALKTDERVRLMDEIISGIQVIKLYAWEKPFSKLISIARNAELKVVKKSSYIRAIYMTFALFTTRTALFCTMMTIVLLGDKLTASKIFVISSYFAILSNTMSQMFVRGIAEIAEALVAMRRLRKFMEYDEKETHSVALAKEKIMNEFGLKGEKIEKEKLIDSETQLPVNIALCLKNVNARWTSVEEIKESSKKKTKHVEGPQELLKYPLTLNNMSVEIKKGILVGVLGHVGAGKSSLLQAILRELPIESGSLICRGILSFANQEPWVFSGSIRQNILFGQELDKDRYEHVVKACALTKDFEMFPYGDQSLIGERGSSLSGGQKARVSFARALYRKADIYLMDDPLSAVDAHVAKHLFEECISSRGLLGKQRATRILVTHQVHFLKSAQWIVIMKDGKIEKQGRPGDLAEMGVDFMKLCAETDEQELRRRGSITKSVSSLNSESLEDCEEEKIEEKEQQKEINVELMSKGKVQGNVSMNYLRAGANSAVLLLSVFLFLFTQVLASMSDYWVSFWIRTEEKRDLLSSLMFSEQNELNETLIQVANNNNNTIDAESIRDESFGLFSSEWLIYIGGILVLCLFILAIIRSIHFYTITVGASRNLHGNSFAGVIASKMRFFDTNPSGRILNRFSKDLGAVDEMLPKACLDSTQVILMTLGSIVITTIINPLFLVPIGSLFIVFLYFRRYFLKTSKNIKRLEGITRSPAFVHLTATLNGLSTIRCFNAEQVLIKEFDQHQNMHTGTWYMYIAVSQAFGFGLDVLCIAFVFLVTFSFLWFDTKDISGSSVGLAISQAMSLTAMLQWGVRQSAEVANQMMAVERILEYRDLEPEQKYEPSPREVEKSWPQRGAIEFKNVVYRYFKEAEPALRGVNFEVRPGEKIGIVGRTGAGKSSLIGAIYRMAELEGEIIIDGIDIGKISLADLRSKISIIPQDPVLFSGTLRRNLDPFEDFADEVLWKALSEVELKDIAGPQGLQTLVAAGGSNFSVGQRQLICLARAVLRNNKILVLDEATANVDPDTDHLIQLTIRKRFCDCTVLTVAHRLHTIMDSDRVLVMNYGIAEEFDTPLNLLELPMGIFRDMVNATGTQESETLRKMAKEKHESIAKEA